MISGRGSAGSATGAALRTIGVRTGRRAGRAATVTTRRTARAAARVRRRTVTTRAARLSRIGVRDAGTDTERGSAQRTSDGQSADKLLQLHSRSPFLLAPSSDSFSTKIS
jgi:hypothetical protein